MQLDFNNPQSLFTREELTELGIVKAEDAGAAGEGKPSGEADPSVGDPSKPAPDKPVSAASAAAPLPAGLDPAVAARLAEAVEKLHTRISDPPKSADPDAEKTIEELLEAGDTKGAIELAKQQAMAGTAEATAQMRAVTASNAKQLFAQTAGKEEFEFWYPKMQEIIKAESLDESQFVTPESWKELLDITRVRNMDVLQERMQAQMAADAGTRIMGGSGGEPSIAASDGIQLTPEERMIARALGVSSKDWNKHSKILEKYDNGRGDIGTRPVAGSLTTGAPVIDSDLANVDQFGDIEIEPGRF